MPDDVFERFIPVALVGDFALFVYPFVSVPSISKQTLAHQKRVGRRARETDFLTSSSSCSRCLNLRSRCLGRMATYFPYR